MTFPNSFPVIQKFSFFSAVSINRRVKTDLKMNVEDIPHAERTHSQGHAFFLPRAGEASEPKTSQKASLKQQMEFPKMFQKKLDFFLPSAGSTNVE